MQLKLIHSWDWHLIYMPLLKLELCAILIGFSFGQPSTTIYCSFALNLTSFNYVFLIIPIFLLKIYHFPQVHAGFCEHRFNTSNDLKTSHWNKKPYNPGHVMENHYNYICATYKLESHLPRIIHSFSRRQHCAWVRWFCRLHMSCWLIQRNNLQLKMADTLGNESAIPESMQRQYYKTPHELLSRYLNTNIYTNTHVMKMTKTKQRRYLWLRATKM